MLEESGEPTEEAPTKWSQKTGILFTSAASLRELQVFSATVLGKTCTIPFQHLFIYIYISKKILISMC